MIIESLHNVFENRKQRRPGYSLRAFARSLELDPSCLSALLKSKRKLTFNMAKKLVENVKEFSPEERFQLLEELVLQSNSNKSARMLLNDKFSLVSDWWNFAILATLQLYPKGASDKVIARRLNLDPTRANIALQRLTRLELVEHRDGKFFGVEDHVVTTDGIPSAALRHCHAQHLELAAKALESQSLEERDISGITFSGNSQKIDQAKKIIKNFRNQICELMEDGDLENRDSVYRLNIH